MGEICRIAQIEPYTLRYWEARHGLLKPARRASGHRRFTREDVERILSVKDMLHRGKLTAAGARRALIRRKKGTPESAAPAGEAGPQNTAAMKLLREVKKELRAVLAELK